MIGLSPHDVLPLRSDFCCSNADPCLRRLLQVLHGLSLQTAPFFQYVFAVFDTLRDGTIDFTEFASAIWSIGASGRQGIIRLVFDLYDFGTYKTLDCFVALLARSAAIAIKLMIIWTSASKVLGSLCVCVCACVHSCADRDGRVTSADIASMIREIHGKQLEQRMPRLVPIIHQVERLLHGRPLIEKDDDSDDDDEPKTVELPTGAGACACMRVCACCVLCCMYVCVGART